MFEPPQLPEVIAYFGPTRDLAKLHSGEDFSTRLEKEITVHEGQIQAENYLLNTMARFQHIAGDNGISGDDFSALLRREKYSIPAIQKAMIEEYGVPEESFTRKIALDPVNTADFMRQRAVMMGAVLSSTPVLIRDPWQGKPVTAKYGFSDFKAEVDGIGFSAIATPRYKDIPFRFAVMKHDHDGYTDNNPAMIMSDEFCDAFDMYNKEEYGHMPDHHHPLIVALATNLKPNIHDRFHNWFLYDIHAASETFKQWGDDIYFVDHSDKNPLLINYEQIALCFHLYAYQTMFDQNPDMKDNMYARLEHAIDEITKFGDFLREKEHPKADAIEESTVYAIVSNIGFVLNPFEDRFQKILEPYPEVKEKLLAVREDGKGVGRTLERLHGYEDGIPSQKYGGAKEAVFEYMLRYPLAEEISAQLKQERSQGRPDDWQMVGRTRVYSVNLEEYQKLPPRLQQQIETVKDSRIFSSVNEALARLPEGMAEKVVDRIEVSEEGYFFLRINRDELDYTQFETRSQHKKVLLVDIPEGQEIRFTNEKKLSLNDTVRKQEFRLIGGKDVLVVNIRDAAAAGIILDYARTPEGGHDPEKIIEKAKELATSIGIKSAGDMYKIEKHIAASQELYGFTNTGFYEATLTKHLARSAGPVLVELHSGGTQRLVKGAYVYLPRGKDPANDPHPDCHLIENTDYKRDYDDVRGTDALVAARLREDSVLMRHEGAQEALDGLLATLHQINFQITHGAEKAARFAEGGRGLFS